MTNKPLKQGERKERYHLLDKELKETTKEDIRVAEENRWYLLTEGQVIQTCCNCGLEHIIVTGLAWKEAFEVAPHGKIAIKFLSIKQTGKKILE